MFPIFPFLFSLAAIVLFASCTSTEQFYVLSPSGPSPRGSGGLSVGLGPVILPEYIDREELVFQSSQHKIEVPSDHLWAGPLTKNVTRVLSTNLGRQLRSANVVPYPWLNNNNPRYHVTVIIDQFHSQTGGDAILEASWRVYKGSDKSITVKNSERFTRPVQTDGYEGIASAQSKLLDDLSVAIAKSIAR